MSDWARSHLPDLRGRCALVTGGAGGLGLETARGLAALGAEVWIADRNVAGAEAAAAQLRAEAPAAIIQTLPIDLADLDSVSRFASLLGERVSTLDLLVNNAGILPPLQRAETRNGFELKFGINVLGHFALCTALKPLLQRSAAPRLVWVSSLVHRHAAIDFDDLQAVRRYEPQTAYNQAKLACLMLAMEAHRRSRQDWPALCSVAAHPGIARTGIGESRRGQARTRIKDRLADAAFWFAMHALGQAADRGARCVLQASAGVDVQGGDFWGPNGLAEFGGDPRRVAISAPAKDLDQCRRLWDVCETLTGTPW